MKLVLTLFLSLIVFISPACASSTYPTASEAKENIKALLSQYEKDPQNVDILRALGVSYHKTGEAGDADAVVKSIEFLEKAAKLKPDDNEIKAWLGSAMSMRARDVVFWEKMNYSNKGTALMDAAISAEPDNITIRLIRGSNYLYAPSFLGKDNIVVSDLEFILKKLQGSDDKELLQDTYYKLGLAYKKVNNTAKAKENFNLAISIDSGSEMAHRIAKEELK